MTSELKGREQQGRGGAWGPFKSNGSDPHAISRPPFALRPSPEPSGPTKIAAEQVLAAHRKALGEVVEPPQGNDAASVGARAILAAYEKALGKTE